MSKINEKQKNFFIESERQPIGFLACSYYLLGLTLRATLPG